MNAEEYMIKQGWKKGQALKPGGIKNAILVTHRTDRKGLGFNPQASEGWWERVFNGHLKSLDFSAKGSDPKFEFDEEKRLRETSPLYAHFRSAGMLEGSIKQKQTEKKSKRKSKDKDSKDKEGKKEKKRKHRTEDEPKTKKSKHN